MDPPETVIDALADRPVEGAVCLEAGAGAGNGTVGLLAAGAERVYAVTNDRAHAETVRDRLDPDESRAAALEGDLRAIPLPDGTVDVVLAHALFGVLPPESIAGIAAELTRVAAPGAHLVIDDYAPLPATSPLRRLFGVENAAAEIATGRAALSFYEAETLARIFAGYGWESDRRSTLLDPVPWTEELLAEHLDVVRSHTTELPPELSNALVAHAEELVADIEETNVGEMYSVAMRLGQGRLGQGRLTSAHRCQ